ncbi:carbohydrate-binding domain-containing protein [Dactylosporangium sp. NPDC051484]|uniref:carbohydrate-binding domain-containing protein n=1 Tax=Dactylosporangium sp. NPDC051484 TaxID=3154942 RepID=UPI003450D821
MNERVLRMRWIAYASIATVLLGYGLFGHAAGTGVTTVDLEAESMRVTSGAAGTYRDPAASGGRALQMWTDATASAELTAPARARLVVRARGDQCSGAPAMRVQVDDQLVETVQVRASSWADYVITGAWGAGTHTLTLSFANDLVTDACDRNLHLDRAVFDASIPASSPRPQPRVLWGLGPGIADAVAAPVYRDAGMGMVTTWYNGPDDLAWISGYARPSTISDLYGSGKAIELVVWLADHPQYAVGEQFQRDIEVVTSALKGSGPHYGPLYVVLFTEWETYSSEPGYPERLKAAYLKAAAAIRAQYAGARVALGFGGYLWDSRGDRDLSFWSDAIAASDFTSVQQMQACDNEHDGQSALVPQIQTSVRQLGSYGKPVMISHFKLWGGPECQVRAFDKFTKTMLNDSSMAELTSDGLFAWNFMPDHYLNDPGPVRDSSTALISTYSASLPPSPHIPTAGVPG